MPLEEVIGRVLRFTAAVMVCLFGWGLACGPLAATETRLLRGAIPDPLLPPARPMTFKLGRFSTSPACGLACAQFIYAEGEIRPDTAPALLIVQNRIKQPLPVYLNSPGGNLDTSLALGRLLREAGSDTHIGALTPLDCTSATNICSEADQRAGITVFASAIAPAICNSSCVYTFAGGINRKVHTHSSLGVHRFFLTRADDPQRRPLERLSPADNARLRDTENLLATYLKNMGVNPEVIALAARTSPADLHQLSREDMSLLQLTTAPGFAGVDLRRNADPQPPAATASFDSAPIMPASTSSAGWPMVMRAGKPYLVLAQPTQSRRFGPITAEIAIGCPDKAATYAVSFAEIVASHHTTLTDSSIRIESEQPDGLRRGDAAAHASSAFRNISRQLATEVENKGVLALEVTSTATAHYPARVEFPARGLNASLDRLERACTGKTAG